MEWAAGGVASCSVPPGRWCRPGAGRKRLKEHDPGLPAALESHLEPITRGDPQSPLHWTCNCVARLAAVLRADCHPVSDRTVNRLLHALGYSVQATARRSRCVSTRTGTPSSGTSVAGSAPFRSWATHRVGR